MEKESYVCPITHACILCPLYGVGCDGVSQEDTPVDDTKVASEPHEFEFERDCYSF